MSMDPSSIVWKASSRSNRTYCVEIARINDEIAVRDSKNPTAGYLTATPAEWSTFLAALKHGRFEQDYH